MKKYEQSKIEVVLIDRSDVLYLSNNIEWNPDIETPIITD